MGWLAVVLTHIEHLSCYWVSREQRAAAFSLRKTPIDVHALHYTYRKNALANDRDRRSRVSAVELFDPSLQAENVSGE